jgi:hypothetical protein
MFRVPVENKFLHFNFLKQPNAEKMDLSEVNFYVLSIFEEKNLIPKKNWAKKFILKIDFVLKTYTQKKLFLNSSAADDIHLREMIWKPHFPAPRYNFFFFKTLHFYD